ncbi:MAG TPA: class I SAM-dependent methyltransferase, partial [Candidatus Limnocylindria bacterium]|nr:class I SAM-dependent methyltransferase [Candidatus Limnocylindria bacterium]
MKALDRLLQRWRIAVAAPWIPSGARVLDVGCADGALFDLLRDRVAGGVGIDPDAPQTSETSATRTREGVRLVRGLFPADTPDERFDAITMLAVIEHLPASSYASVGSAAARLLGEGGRLIATVPEPAVDRIVELLQRLRLAEGMS